jgi:hypothetical protein
VRTPIRNSWACRFLSLVALALSSGCSSSSSPAQPSPPPTTSTLTVTGGADAIKVGETTVFTAQAGGTSAATAVQAQWSVDVPAVATVDGSGRVTGVSAGTATVTATHQSRTATRSLRVVPDFQGFWAGDSRVTACTQSSGFAPSTWCTQRRDRFFPTSVTIEQVRERASGGLWMDPVARCIPTNSVPCPNAPGGIGKASSQGLQFTIDVSGRLVGGGTFVMTAAGVGYVGQVTNWSTSLAAGRLTGRTTVVWTGSGQGTATEELEVELRPAVSPFALP